MQIKPAVPFRPSLRHLLALSGLLLICFGPDTLGQEIKDVRVDHVSHWRVWLDFGPDHVDPVLLRQMVDELVSERGKERIEDEARTMAAAKGIDVNAAGFNWLDHVYLLWEPYLSSYSPFVPDFNNEWKLPDGDTRLTSRWIPPAAVDPDWAKPDFHEKGWVGRASPVQTGSVSEIRGRLSNSLQTATTNVQAAYYRTNFDSRAGDAYHLDVTYRGGLRVFLNGTEILARHVVVDGGEERVEGYSRAFNQEKPQDRGDEFNREVEGFALPPELMRTGGNVLAIQTIAPKLHPQALLAERKMGRGRDRDREFVIAPAHTGLVSVALSGPGTAARERPAGLQVWVTDPQHQLYERDFLPMASQPGTLRLVGPRNSIVSGILVLGSDQDVKPLAFEIEAPRGAGGVLEANALSLRGMLPRPATVEGFKSLGAHRGYSSLGNNHAVFDQLPQWRFRRFKDKGGAFFDEIGTVAPDQLTANTTQPVWVELTIPADAAPGKYQGAILVKAGSGEPVRVPVECEVIDWLLPAPAGFASDVWIEQSPYGLAQTAGVDLWSDAHFALIEQSFRQLGRSGAAVVHVPVLQFTEFGNQEDSMIRWSQDAASGELRADFSIMDRYLNLAFRYLEPRVVAFTLMQGAGGKGRGSEIMKNITTIPLVAGGTIDLASKPGLYEQVARQIHEHMKAAGKEKVMDWGMPWDFPPNPELPGRLAEVAPGVGWVRAGHCDLGTPEWVSVQSEVWPSWRNRPDGVINTLNPRRHSPFHVLEGSHPPFAFRIFPIRAARNGYTGIGRMGADYGNSWGLGNRATGAVPDFGVKNFFWLADNQVHSSQRYEILREGLQEAEAWRFLVGALSGGHLAPDLAKRVQTAMDSYIAHTAHLQAIYFGFQNPTFHDHSQGWQERSRELFTLAAEVQKLHPAQQ